MATISESPFHYICPQWPEEDLTDKILSHVTSLKDFQALVTAWPKQAWVERINRVALGKVCQACYVLGTVPSPLGGFSVDARFSNPPQPLPSISALRNLAVLHILPLGYQMELIYLRHFDNTRFSFFALDWTKAMLELGIFEDFRPPVLLHFLEPAQRADKFFQMLCKAMPHPCDPGLLKTISEPFFSFHRDAETFFKTWIKYCVDHREFDSLRTTIREILSFLHFTGRGWYPGKEGFAEDDMCWHAIDLLLEAHEIDVLMDMARCQMFYNPTTDRRPNEKVMTYLADRLHALGKREEATQVVRWITRPLIRERMLDTPRYVSLSRLCLKAVRAFSLSPQTVKAIGGLAASVHVPMLIRRFEEIARQQKTT